MVLIDLHCDVLYKMEKSHGRLNFYNEPSLDVNIQKLEAGRISSQCFAIFVDPDVPFSERFSVAKRQIAYFEQMLAEHKQLKQVKKIQDIKLLAPGEIGAILTLEGVDVIEDDLSRLAYFYEKGVKSIGLTWNHANLAADGIEEKRGAGLTDLGFQIIEENNQRGVLTDVSHLSEAGFWDVMERADYPIASHSNAKGVCPHIRNLTDEQIQALIAKNAMIHVVFYPPFLTDQPIAKIDDIIRHIDYIASLGGIRHIGFGSDFDGITEHVVGLEHTGKYQALIDALAKRYSDDQVRGFMGHNFLEAYRI